jgi:hypothetical protein
MNARRALLLLLLTTPILRADSCGPVIADPGFELWCAESLCSWRVDTGQIQRAPTWHRADFGVELIDPDTQISQPFQGGVACLAVKTLADVEENASLELLIDFHDDGVIDHRQPIVGRRWARSEFLITPPAWYERARVLVRKAGTGRAVLAELGVSQEAAASCTAAPVAIRDAALGLPCEADSECRQRHCAPSIPRQTESALGKVCGACASDEHCGPQEVCGLTTASPHLPYAACTPPGRDPLGAACRTDRECKSGICCSGVCSTCCPDARGGCGATETCDNGQPVSLLFPFGINLAWRCSPDSGKRTAGEPCVGVDDCASGSCSSTIALGFCPFNGRDCVEHESCGGSECAHRAATPGTCR